LIKQDVFGICGVTLTDELPSIYLSIFWIEYSMVDYQVNQFEIDVLTLYISYPFW
jgi:hypothetical protein